MADLDKLLRSDISRAAADVVEPPDFAPIERRGVQRRRTRHVLTGAAAAVVVLLLGLGTLQILNDDDDDRLTPISPRPPSTTPSTTWGGPLREGSTLPLLSTDERGGGGEIPWRDRQDAAFGGIDIRRVLAEPGTSDLKEWTLYLRQAPPPGTRRILEYGIVVDTDRDQDADCQIGINNDSREPGEYRVWVTNLRTGATAVQDGPPYGFPVDFVTPEPRGTFGPPHVKLNFLGGSNEPCDPIGESASFYTWASVGDGHRVTAWDYAPDNGWLAMM